MLYGLIIGLLVTLMAVRATYEWHDYEQSFYHLGVRISPSYLRAMWRLRDPDDVHPYRTFVIHIYNPRTWPLWRMACRVERRDFGLADHNTPLELWRAAFRFILTTSLVFETDQRWAHKPFDVPVGMIRNIRGSVFGLPTFHGMASPKYWHVKNLAEVRKRNGIPWYAAFWLRAMDITMIAVLPEYQGMSIYSGRIPVTLGLLAQTCRLAEDTRIRWWFTILDRAAYNMIQKQTGQPWRFFKSITLEWMSYWGSPPSGSMPLCCNVPWYMWVLFTYNRERFDQYFRGGMSSGHRNWFTYNKRRAEVRDPALPPASWLKYENTQKYLPLVA